jgi:Fe-S-cluster-containing dehydrogenase component/DMSO reductase anchor subunit
VIENGLEPEGGWRQVFTFNEHRLPGVPLFHLSLACNHCEIPACLEACPALAYSRDATTGAVLIDEEKCIGCRYCSWACPYDAPRFDAARGVMTKCTFCNDRLQRGGQPACAELCPTGALRYESLPEAEITHDVEGFPRSELRPSIRIVPLRAGRQAPEPDPAATEVAFDAAPRRGDGSRVGLRSEWPLAVFTLLGAALFAAVAAAVLGGPSMHPAAFLATAIAGVAVGSAHLGRKGRAWRAVLGVSRSWLSREIVLYSVFVACGAVYLARAPGAGAAGGVGIVVGLATLLAMDRVYRFAVSPARGRGAGDGPSPARLPVHSASVLFTGVFLAGVLAGSVEIAVASGGAKLALYLARKVRFARSGLAVRLGVAVPRVVCGFLVPAALWMTASPTASGIAFVCVILAEALDRLEFYAELEFPTPARQMAIDLSERVASGRRSRHPRRTPATPSAPPRTRAAG